jgi:hypothetical protein
LKLEVEGIQPEDLEAIPGLRLVSQERRSIVVLFADNNEERFVDVLACKQCGRVQLMVDYETDVEGEGV